MENLIILKVISKHDFSKCLKRCSGLLIREIQIKVISNYQNGKDLKVYFLLPLSRNILTSVGSIHWYCLTFLQRGLYLSKFKIHIFFRPIILLYPDLSNHCPLRHHINQQLIRVSIMAVFVIAKNLGNWLSQYLPTLEDYVAYKKDGILYDLSPRYVIKINSNHFYVLKEVGGCMCEYMLFYA